MTYTHPSPKRGPAPDVPYIRPCPSEILVWADTLPATLRGKFVTGPGCWPWTQPPNGAGYGMFRHSLEQNPVTAHRAMHRLHYPNVDLDGLVVDHLCRNKLCVRPDHLEAVTNQENTRRGCLTNITGVCRAGTHLWVEENIYHYPDGRQACRECRRLNREGKK